LITEHPHSSACGEREVIVVFVVFGILVTFVIGCTLMVVICDVTVVVITDRVLAFVVVCGLLVVIVVGCENMLDVNVVRGVVMVVVGNDKGFCGSKYSLFVIRIVSIHCQ
jgi:hypothetical protein